MKRRLSVQGVNSGLEQEQSREQPPQGPENDYGFICVALVEEAVLKGVREPIANAGHALFPLRGVACNSRDGWPGVLGEIKEAARVALVSKVAKSGLHTRADIVTEILDGFECLAPRIACLAGGHPLALREEEPVQALGHCGQLEELRLKGITSAGRNPPGLVTEA